MSLEFDLIDHSEEVLHALERQVEAALEGVGNQAVSHAKQVITEESRVDTGALRNSVNHQVNMGDKAVYVGTNQSYAIYNEMGTGIHIGGGRKTPWVFRDAKGEWHRTSGMKPIHFLKKAAADHTDEYKAIIKKYLSR